MKIVVRLRLEDRWMYLTPDLITDGLLVGPTLSRRRSFAGRFATYDGARFALEMARRFGGLLVPYQIIQVK